MTTPSGTRNFSHFVTCVSCLLVVTMVTRTFSQHAGNCTAQTFGSRCHLTCQCQDEAPCDDVTGRCPSACRKGWLGPNCQTNNVVLGMPTEMKTSDWSKGARAVDGDVGTCVTSQSNRTGWWRVDMLVPRAVFFMEIFFAISSPANEQVPSSRVRVHVSDYMDTFWGKPCTRLPGSHKRSKFACDVPSKGRYFGIINQFGQITLCEVRVFVCTPYTYGVDCSQMCNCDDTDEVCNPVNGACRSGCREGWTGSSCHRRCQGRYGRKCRHQCGHCSGGVACHHMTGDCPSGCEAGWEGPKCTHGCVPGQYGLDCNHTCHHCLDNVTCDSVTGHCPWRCDPGWQGSKCDTPCTAGWYGQSCNFTCGQCYQGSACDGQTGMCSMGCVSGYQGLFCTQGCSPGRWGPNCRWECGHCASPGCDQVKGHCHKFECQAGYMGLKCQTRTHGPMCLNKCGHCQDGCDPGDGSCLSPRCLQGWQGSKCDTPCSNNTFGHDCQSVCGQCSSGQGCDHVTGHCPGSCVSDFLQPACLSRRSSSRDSFRPDLHVLLICCIAVGACILAAITAALFIIRWRRSRNTPSYKYAPPPLVQQTTV